MSRWSARCRNPRTRFPTRVLVLVGRGRDCGDAVHEAMQAGRARPRDLSGARVGRGRGALYAACDVFALPTGAGRRRPGRKVWPGVRRGARVRQAGRGGPVGRRGGRRHRRRDRAVVEPEDPDALADAILRLMEDPELARRMGENGRRRVEEELNWDGSRSCWKLRGWAGGGAMRGDSVSPTSSRGCAKAARRRTRFTPCAWPTATGSRSTLSAARPTGSEGSIEDAVRRGGNRDHARCPTLCARWRPFKDLARSAPSDADVSARNDTTSSTRTRRRRVFWARLAAVRARRARSSSTRRTATFSTGYFSSPRHARCSSRMERYAARRTRPHHRADAGRIEEHLDAGHRPARTIRDASSAASTCRHTTQAIAPPRRDAPRAGHRAGALLIGGVGRLEPVKGFTYFCGRARQVAERVPECAFRACGTRLAGSRAARSRPRRPWRTVSVSGSARRRARPDGGAWTFLCCRPSTKAWGACCWRRAPRARPAWPRAWAACPISSRDGETGVLVPPRDPAHRRRRVCRLARDPDGATRHGRAARAEVAPHYGLDRWWRASRRCTKN